MSCSVDVSSKFLLVYCMFAELINLLVNTYCLQSAFDVKVLRESVVCQSWCTYLLLNFLYTYRISLGFLRLATIFLRHTYLHNHLTLWNACFPLMVLYHWDEISLFFDRLCRLPRGERLKFINLVNTEKLMKRYVKQDIFLKALYPYFLKRYRVVSFRQPKDFHFLFDIVLIRCYKKSIVGIRDLYRAWLIQKGTRYGQSENL